MSLLEKAKFLLRSHRVFPNRLLGQNFMIDPTFFHNISDYVSLNQEDVVLDAGAGLGFLTRYLANRSKKVLAVETDRRLVKVLQEQLSCLGNVKIIKGSVLKVSVPDFNKVVSIPPYRISSQLILWLFNRRFDRAALIFQREFANRLVASLGDKDYGWLAVVTYYYANCELLDEVPRSAFYPQPEVESVTIHLSMKKPPPFKLNDEEAFTRLVQSLFTQRNRKLRNAVLPFLKDVCGKTAEAATRIANGLDFHDRRVRELAPEDFGALANVLSN